MKQAQITDHPVFPGRIGLGARRIENDADVRDVIDRMRLNYERVATLPGGKALSSRR